MMTTIRESLAILTLVALAWQAGADVRPSVPGAPADVLHQDVLHQDVLHQQDTGIVEEEEEEEDEEPDCE